MKHREVEGGRGGERGRKNWEGTGRWKTMIDGEEEGKQEGGRGDDGVEGGRGERGERGGGGGEGEGEGEGGGVEGKEEEEEEGRGRRGSKEGGVEGKEELGVVVYKLSA